MEIKLTNTYTREKEVFKSIESGHVKIYTCGLTVYNYAHIGNLRAYVFSDVLKRMFLFNGYKVKHVMNITDVGHLSDDADSGEDKLEKGARREGKSVWEIARFFEEEFLKDLKNLNILIPVVLPRATEHIDDMIEIIEQIQSNGYTYRGGGNLYFDTSKAENYGKLGRLKLDEDKTISRVEKDPYKKHSFDFVLWFTRYKYKKHSMIWDSPWGEGFPGWHIECSAMSSKYLGKYFDIHTGGIDHIPVHHTNEIAQSEAAFGSKWVNYWLHSDFLVIEDNEKMSKSKENFLRLTTLVENGFSPEDYRYYLLGAHYRKNLLFNFDSLESAKNAMKKLKNRIIDFLRINDQFQKDKYDLYANKFNYEINDDLNTPRALAVLWEVVGSEDISNKTKISLLKRYDEILGLKLLSVKEDKISDEILELKNERDIARKIKNWAKADEIRGILLKKGYEILDKSDGSELRKI